MNKTEEKEVLLDVQDVSLGYEGSSILEHLSFTVHAGDFLCIVGENGSGKTTLMKTLLKLQEPLAGKIVRSDTLKGASIGYLPQQTVIQRDFPASVYEIVLSGCLCRMGRSVFYRREDRQRADAAMERLGITHLKDTCYRVLSGGQQQRVLLARALCAAEEVLLLDEPVTGLDPRVSAELYALIRQLNAGGITILMISHDIASAVRDASHILHIGQKVFFGTAEEYRSSRIGRYFLEAEGSEEE